LAIGIATNDRWKDKSTGEMKERSEFHNIVVWGALAEEVSRFVKKGNRVFVAGRVQTRSWETQAGGKRTTTEIIAESLSLLGTRNALAEESLQADAMPQRAARSAAPDTQDFGSDPAPSLPSVPALEYKSEIKVEDLPF